MSEGFNFIDLLILAGIAIFLISRLRAVLGRRDGTDGNHGDPFQQGPSQHPGDNGDEDVKKNNVFQFPSTDPQAGDDELDAREEPSSRAKSDQPDFPALKEIFAADPSMTPDRFVEGAKSAFDMILQAYAATDLKTLEFLLSEDVFKNFSAAIEQREQKGEVLEFTLIGFKKANIVDASLEDNTASITVKFVTDQVMVTRDSEDQVVDGDPGTVTTNVDIWTFSRRIDSKNPNWLLVATETD